MCMFRTPYSKEVRVPSHGITFTEESKTLQSEYESTTIDWYLKRYSATGVDPFANRIVDARFGDFSNYESFLTAQTKLAQVRQGFDNLPSEIRAKFNNNINAFMEFVTNPENEAELVSLGLVKQSASETQSTTGTAPVVDVQTPVVEAQPSSEDSVKAE